MKTSALALLTNQALRRLLTFLDARLTAAEFNPPLRQRVAREWQAAQAEYERRLLDGVVLV